jgi:nitrate reductase NapAB chaperone NapD
VPISGLVVVFESSEALSDQRVQQLAEHAAIEVGERQRDRVAIVVDSTSKDQDRQVWEWLQSLPGVSDIKIAFVGFDDVADEDAPQESGGVSRLERC